MFIKFIKEYEKSSILINFIMIIASILLIINPSGILNLVMNIIGITILADGIFKLVSYFSVSKEERMFNNNLFWGSLAIVAGIIILIKKTFLISLLPMLIGIWIIARSIMKFQMAFNLKDNGSERWITILISSIISLLLGILIIANPFGTVLTVTIIAGIILLISSIIDLLQSLAIMKIL